MLAKNLGTSDRRSSARFRRSFTVRINGCEHEGMDISLNGFSIKTSDRYIHFLMKQRLKGVVIVCGEIEYEIALSEVRSYRQKSGAAIYGVKILQANGNDMLLHEKVATHPKFNQNSLSVVNGRDAGVRINEVLSELILACESPVFDDCEFRALALNQLKLLKKII